MTILSTEECAWSKTKVVILGRTMVGIRGFQIDKEVDKEHLYASGQDPIDIQEGNIKPSGNFKSLKFEVDAMNEVARTAGYEDITAVPHTLIHGLIEYKKTDLSKIRTVLVSGIAFTSLGVGMEQGAKMTEITLPFLNMKTAHV